MKTLTTLTAVAALVPGMSFSSPHSPMKPAQAKCDGPPPPRLSGQEGKKA